MQDILRKLFDPKRWAYQADDEDEEAGDIDDVYWVQDAEGYWYEWDDAEQGYIHYGDAEEAEEDDAFHIEDEVDRNLASEDENYMNALVTLRESRERMNKMRTARGFFKGKIEGMLDESTAALDADSEMMVYQQCQTRGMGYLSVAHRPTVIRFHTNVLRFFFQNETLKSEVIPGAQLAEEVARQIRG